MFSVSDLLTVCVLEEAFEFLSRNPHHLEFALCAFTQNKWLANKLGQEYMAQAIDLVTNNKIQISTYYEADLEKFPSITIVSSGYEEQKFIGETGISQTVDINRPITYARWTAVSIDGAEMVVPASEKLDEKLWPGLIIANEDPSVKPVKLIGILKNEAQTILCLSEPIDDTPPKGWIAASGGSYKKYQTAASKEDVTVQCKLTTNGDLAIHRILSIALRWALKKYRLRFDAYGMQEAIYSYTPPVVTDDSEHVFESVYTIKAQYTDHWIEKEWNTLPEGTNFVPIVTAVNEAEEKEDVKLD